MPRCVAGSSSCGGHAVSISGTTVHVTDCRGIASGRGGGVISYCIQDPIGTPVPPTPPPTPPPCTDAWPSPCAGRIIGRCVGWPNPHVEIRWSSFPPPGRGAKDSNSIKRGPPGGLHTWFYAGGWPGVWATRISGAAANPWGAGGYPAPNYSVYDLRDDSVQVGQSYEYVAKYRADLASLNMYRVTVDAASCGGGAAATPTPAPTPYIAPGSIAGSCIWSLGVPQVRLSWSALPPPGQGAATTVTLEKGDAYPDDPGRYWGSVFSVPNIYTYGDGAVMLDTQYQYRVKYRSDLPSVNTYNIFVSNQNCGGPAPTPGPLDLEPGHQTLPPGVTAFLTATGGDGNYSWEAEEGTISGSGSTVSVVFTNASTESVDRRVTVRSGGQEKRATVVVQGVQTFQDDIDLSAQGGRFVLINGGTYAYSPDVSLTLSHGFAGVASADVTMKLARTSEELAQAPTEPFAGTRDGWNLCGASQCPEGQYAVHAQFFPPAGSAPEPVLDTIILLEAPAGVAAVAVNGGAPSTNDRSVELTLVHGIAGAPDDEVTMQVANTADAVADAPALPYSSSVGAWDLCEGLGASCDNGTRTVFVRFCRAGSCTSVIEDSITLDSPWPAWGVRINDDAESTGSGTVTLTLNPWFAKPGTQVYLSNFADLSDALPVPYAETITWDLCAGRPLPCESGTREVFAFFVNTTESAWPRTDSPIYQDAIELGVVAPTPTPTPEPAAILIDDGAAVTTSRFVEVTFSSPFGTTGVTMRTVNEAELSPADRVLVGTHFEGGIPSEPKAPDTGIPPQTELPPLPGGFRDVQLVVDDGLQTRELSSGTERPYTPEISSWDLCAGAAECPYGEYKIYVQYYSEGSAGAAVPGVGAATMPLISEVYYDSIVYAESTPVPSVSGSPQPSGAPVLPSGGPVAPIQPGQSGVGGPSPWMPSFLLNSANAVSGAVGPAAPAVGTLAVASVAAVVASAVAALSAVAIPGVAAFAWQSLMGAIGLLPKRKKVWGTVYASDTKRPIPFAKVQLLDRNKRVLETRVADREGRYGFLTTPESLLAQQVQIQVVPVVNGYTFPSRNPPSVDSFVYGNVYYGELVTMKPDTLINFDVPMDPAKPTHAPLLARSPSVALGAAVAAIADVGFWLGLVMVPLAFFMNPNPFTLGIVFLFLGTASLRMWGISEHPFGTVTDAKTGRPVPFALVTLNDLSGKRVGFAVSDEQGRYFIVAPKGSYELSAFTPATIVPPRQFKGRVDIRKGWLTKPLKL